jgi:phage terminase large subunit-like protein
LIITDYKKQIYNPENGGVLRALSSRGKTKHGSNPSTVIFDELHVWGQHHQELYDALTTGSGTRRQPLRLAITTAGHDESSICFREYSYAKRVQDGTVNDPTYYSEIHELPADADWTDESLWHLANPSIDLVVSRQMLREERDEALNSPSKQNAFRQLYCNQWTESNEVWIPVHTWDKCGGAVNLERLKKEPCWGGLDLAAVNDLTSFVLWWEVDGHYYVKPWFFIPEYDSAGANIHERGRKCGVDFAIWQKLGYLDVTEGNWTDWTHVTKKIAQIAQQYDVRNIAFDRYGARDVVTRLQQDGMKVEPWGQGYLDMSPPCKRLESLILSQRISHGGNPILRWNIQCANTATDPAGNIKLVKPSIRKTTKRIDGIVAMAMACGIHMREADPGTGIPPVRIVAA